MKNYISTDAWSIIENGFHPEHNKITESIFSLGNGRFGGRANFEEHFSGDTLQGNYVAGIYYPDKTRVGWWKNGYPEYFAKVLNAANWTGIYVEIDGEKLDMATASIHEFRRELNMKEGWLQRTTSLTLANGKKIAVKSTRFLSIADDETAVIKYSVTALDADVKVRFEAYIDGEVKNQDANYDEKFWEPVAHESADDFASLTLGTKKTKFHVSMAMHVFLEAKSAQQAESRSDEKYVASVFEADVSAGETVTLYKYMGVVSCLNYEKSDLAEAGKQAAKRAAENGFETMLAMQAQAWAAKWETNDIVIEGDDAAQQGIRFNIFQLNQTYTGEDEKLNIGPKGFTGEKYGGSTYWDTEAYCIPFYLATAPQKVSRNLLVYRYKHLQKAIENAQKLGFGGGAALYPMVTMNGEECHNEWEITFEEIHRNGAIAFAIYNYVRYTGDAVYLGEYGLEVLIAISRFWAQRVNWSEEKKQYVMLGVTGPNEYENNINNNWYTSYLASWCMEYTSGVVDFLKDDNYEAYRKIVDKTGFDERTELQLWAKIWSNMYLGEDKERGIFLQQDGFLDKEQILVSDLKDSERPLNQKWSWDRILRSPFIKQADVLQGIYLFEDKFDEETIRKNYDYYEPRTVHESSLSPCVHAILAAKLRDDKRAYEFYLRTSRLDLDDYNNDTEDGLHITSMAGTWMSVVEGFGGMRVKDSELHFNPILPANWASYTFKIGFRDALLAVTVRKGEVQISKLSGPETKVWIGGKEHGLK